MWSRTVFLLLQDGVHINAASKVESVSPEDADLRCIHRSLGNRERLFGNNFLHGITTKRVNRLL